MKGPTDFMFSQEQRRIAGEIAFARQQMLRAKNCREAVAHMVIHVRAPYQSLRATLGVPQFEAEAERRLRQIVDEQLQRFKSSSGDDTAALRERLLDDWQALRGRAASVHHYAHRELQRIEARIPRENSPGI